MAAKDVKFDTDARMAARVGGAKLAWRRHRVYSNHRDGPDLFWHSADRPEFPAKGLGRVSVKCLWGRPRKPNCMTPIGSAVEMQTIPEHSQ